MGITTKGRTSSRQLARVLGKVNAYFIAGHAVMGLAFVRSALNPADRPSRLKRGKEPDSPSGFSDGGAAKKQRWVK